MPKFERNVDVAALIGWDRDRPGNAVRALFDRWAFPGQPGNDGAGLRIGLRNGYLNFYAKGQSVARLSLVRGGPRLAVHRAYVEGRRRGDKVADAGAVYVTHDEAQLADPATAALIPGWIDTALSHAGAEKRFVDELTAVNPGVIDLEMGLPASDLGEGERVAPRMDLVVAETSGKVSAALAFWEAKWANNGELRAREGAPPVVGQVRRYVAWMGQHGRLAEVRAAYRSTARVLLALQACFRPGEADSQCVAVWRALAAAEPEVVVQPGIVVANYWPKGCTEKIASGRIARCAASFAANGHRAKLIHEGIAVHEIGPDEPLSLPPLQNLTVAA